MMIGRRGLLFGLAGSLVPGQSRGAVAFHYEAVFPPDAAEWYTRFRTLVTGAVLPEAQTARLRKRATRLIAYEWSSGFYPGDAVSIAAGWESTVRRNAGKWLLSAEPAGGAAAAPGRTALWYDFGDAGLREARADYLESVLRKSGYDGLFFDTPGFENVPAPLKAAFEQRHPGIDYNHAQGQFFGVLKKRIGESKLIFLNQGYRHAEHMLPHADLDLSESYFTAVDGASMRFRAWNDPAALWESIRTPMEQLIMPAARRFPKVRFVHVNYAAGGPAITRRAARYSWACAKLWNHDAYLIAPGAYAGERDDIYFNETGPPQSDGYRESGGVVWREFEKGVVAVNTATTPSRVPGLGLPLPEGQQGYFFPRR